MDAAVDNGRLEWGRRVGDDPARNPDDFGGSPEANPDGAAPAVWNCRSKVLVGG